MGDLIVDVLHDAADFERPVQTNGKLSGSNSSKSVELGESFVDHARSPECPIQKIGIRPVEPRPELDRPIAWR
jgi:hypothetical protein